MNRVRKNLLEIHAAVFLFGLSGLFGKLLALPPMFIVLGRVFFSSIFLFCLLLLTRKKIKIADKKALFLFFLSGGILAIHWTTYFGSIQKSTVAIGLLTFSTFPIFVTFLEPIFFHEKIKAADILIAGITFLGVFFVVPSFSIQSNVTQGAILGVISGFTYAVLSMMNKKYTQKYSSLMISFYEQVSATVFLLPTLVLYHPLVHGQDVFYLVILGTLCTGIAHSLFIHGLSNVKTQTAGIISSLEPIYGILFALLLLREIPTQREGIGGFIILLAVFFSTLQSQRTSKNTV